MKNPFPYSLIAFFILAIVISGCSGGNNGGTTPKSYTPGQSKTYTIGSISFDIHYIPNVISFPIGINDSGIGSVSDAYWMAETEVTYQLWSTVYTWAVSHNYTFANPGSRGGYFNVATVIGGTYSSNHENDPTTMINWRDVIVWCNALTEYYNTQNGMSLNCVYKSGGNPIRDATDTLTCIAVAPDSSAKGFRLPTSMEWELAARYKDGTNWTPGNYASGATADYTNVNATNVVAWVNSNYPDPNIFSTQSVGGKVANALGLKDMSGNVWEWCFDWLLDEGCRWKFRGGGYITGASSLQVSASGMQIGLVILTDPNLVCTDLGFRPVRTE